MIIPQNKFWGASIILIENRRNSNPYNKYAQNVHVWNILTVKAAFNFSLRPLVDPDTMTGRNTGAVLLIGMLQ